MEQNSPGATVPTEPMISQPAMSHREMRMMRLRKELAELENAAPDPATLASAQQAETNVNTLAGQAPADDPSTPMIDAVVDLQKRVHTLETNVGVPFRELYERFWKKLF